MNALQVKSRKEFVEHVRDLVARLRSGEASFENATLDAYLEAMAAWTEDMDGYFGSRKEPVPVEPSWGLIAMMLEAAAVYE